MPLLAIKLDEAVKIKSVYGTEQYQNKLQPGQEEEITSRVPEIAKAIKVAEGDPARFGVKSIPVKSMAEAEKILNNSIYNNYVRWMQAGKSGKFIDFMQKRWAPIGAENDPKNLNKNWAPNVRNSLQKQLDKKEYKKWESLNLVSLSPFNIGKAEASELTSVKTLTAVPNLVAIKPEEMEVVTKSGGAGGGWSEYKKIPLPGKWFKNLDETIMNSAVERLVSVGADPVEIRSKLKGLSDIGKFTDRLGINFLNSVFFGLPLYGLKKAGFVFEDPESTSEIVAGAIGDLGGFITGPAKAGQILARKIPVVGRVFNLTTTKAQSIIKPIARSALSLGTSFGLMTPEEGLLAPEARLRQFGSGATMGTAFGVLGFIPSTPLRSLITSAYVGVPATLREEPLEMQIFNYGLGAFYGWKGKIKPNELLAQEGKLAKYLRHGADVPEAMLLLDRSAKDLKTFIKSTKTYGPEPIGSKARFNQTLKRNGVGHYDPMKDIIGKETYKLETKPAGREVKRIPRKIVGLNKDVVQEITRLINKLTKGKADIHIIGSRARGTYGAGSDIDIMIIDPAVKKPMTPGTMGRGGVGSKYTDLFIKFQKEYNVDLWVVPSKKYLEAKTVKLYASGLGEPLGVEKIPSKSRKDYYTPQRLPELGKDYVYGVRLKDGTTFKGLPKDLNHADVLRRYKKQAGKGLIKQFGVVDLRNNKMMVGESEINFKSRPIRDVLTKPEKVKIKEKAIKEWRDKTATDLHRRLYNLSREPEFELRSDDLRFVISQIGTSKKALSELNNTDLYNIGQVISKSEKPSTAIFETRPATKRGFVHQRLINAWDVSLRKGYGLLQKLGYGDEFGTGLTNQYFRAEVNERNFIYKYVELSNNWKRIVGINKEGSRKIFDYLDGNLHKNHLSSKEFTVAKQMKSYLDFSLGITNRHRAVYGQEPIKGVTDYITHIFDNTLWVNPGTGQSIGRKEFLDRKYPFAEHLEGVLKWTTPKEKQSPFLKRRVGGLHYVRDIWRALDTYTRTVAQMVNDDPIRRSHSIANFLRREMALNKKTGKRTVVDLAGIEEQTRMFAQDYVGRPGRWDKYIKNSAETINKILPESMKIKSVTGLSNALTATIYGTQMSFRLKTAIRNYSQHGMIIGRTGFKPLIWAIKTLKNKPFIAADGKSYVPSEITKNSLVMQSRPGAYAPEIEAISGSKLIQTGMIPFKKVDLLNVRDAYLAGWKYEMDRSKSVIKANKYADQTAGITQFIYLRGNRSMLSRGMGVSKTLGRPLSVFTTWSANYAEFLVASATPEHRVNLIKYLAYSTAIMTALGAAGIKGLEYTGIGSLSNLWSIFTGKLPITGVMEKPSIQAVRDLVKGIEGGIKDMLFYTYNKEDRE